MNKRENADARASDAGHRSPVTGHCARPWHKQLWPWLLIAPPFASVIGGIALAWIAVASDDGLVTPDYYRQGTAINERLTREQAANCAVKDRACMNAPVKDSP